MKKKFLSIICLVVSMCAVVFFQSCKKDNSGPQRFYVTLQQYNGDKLYINEPYSYWEVNDPIAVTNTEGRGTILLDSSDPDNPRYYISVTGVDFTATSNNNNSIEMCAVYPYDLYHISQYNPNSQTQIELEPTQVYEENPENGYQKLKAPMAAYLAPVNSVVFNNNAPTFEFKNLCALLKVNIQIGDNINANHPIYVTRIEVENTGATADPLWGDFDIAFPGTSTTNPTQPKILKRTQADKYVTKKLILNINHYGTDNVHLTGGDPISRNANHPFYIYLPPVDYDDVHITVYIKDNNVEKYYTLVPTNGNSGTFEANTIYPVTISYSQNDYPTAANGWHIINEVNNIGAFTIDNQGHQVTFSRANVQGLNDYTGTDYFFALHQYHYIGDPSHNPFGIYDHFDRSHEQFIISHFYNDFSEHWRLLTADELTYLLETRSGDKFCWAKVASVPGIILFPDNYNRNWLPTGFPVDYINTVRIEYEGPYSSTPLPNTPAIDVYTWYSNFESKGCVFMPCLYMNGTQASSLQLYSFYWLSDGEARFQTGSSYSTDGTTATAAYIRLVQDISSK